MAALRLLGFLIFNFFNSRAVKRPILHHNTKCRKDRSNRCRNIAIFVIFLKMVAAAILDFQKFEILTVDPVYGVGPICVTMPNFIKIDFQQILHVARNCGSIDSRHLMFGRQTGSRFPI